MFDQLEVEGQKVVVWLSEGKDEGELFSTVEICFNYAEKR